MALYTSRSGRSKTNPVWVTPGGSAVAHTPPQWAAYQSRHVGARLPRQAAREAQVEAHGPLAPGWDILPNFVVHEGGKRQQIYRLFYQGKDTGKYSLDVRKAAEMSHGINPATGKRWKKGEQVALANGREPVSESTLSTVRGAPTDTLKRWAQGPSYYDTQALEVAESAGQVRHITRKIHEARDRAPVAQRELERRKRAKANPRSAGYVLYAMGAEAKGKTPAQIKKAYDKSMGVAPVKVRNVKKTPKAKAVSPKTLMQKLGVEIGAVTRKLVGDPSFLWEAGMLEEHPETKTVKIVLSSSKYSEWKVDDPKYVAALRSIAKKYAPQGVKMTVAVKNPRY